ncbi:MAG: sensor histidine kinase, partial [Acidimicrobiales bacterium]
MSKPGPVPTSKPVPVSHACAEDGNPFGGGSRIFNRRAGRVWSLVWLAWLAYPLSALFESHASTLHVALTVLGATVAVGAYVSLFGCESLFDPPTARDWAALVVLGALGVALTAFDRPDWLTLLYFVASGGAMRLPGRRYLPVLAAALATVALGSWLAGSGTSNLLSSVGIVFALGAALAGFRQVLGTNVALIAARNEVARLAVAEERLRFARDLHDLLGHSLSVIALKAELAGRLIERSPDRAAGEVTDICSVARSALAEVREAVGGYRQVGLAGEVVSARSALAAAGIELEVSGVSEAAALSPEVSETAAWVLRE